MKGLPLIDNLALTAELDEEHMKQANPDQEFWDTAGFGNHVSGRTVQL
jgi:hypothetical protein